jgi:hypothetical protein
VGHDVPPWFLRLSAARLAHPGSDHKISQVVGDRSVLLAARDSGIPPPVSALYTRWHGEPGHGVQVLRGLTGAESERDGDRPVHIGREALDTMLVIRKWEQAGVPMWSARTDSVSRRWG